MNREAQDLPDGWTYFGNFHSPSITALAMTIAMQMVSPAKLGLLGYQTDSQEGGGVGTRFPRQHNTSPVVQEEEGGGVGNRLPTQNKTSPVVLEPES